MKRICLIFAFVSLALCACNEVENNQTNIEEVPGVYHLSIQASMDPQTKGVTFNADGQSATSQFEVGDKIYVYNKTQDALARHWDGTEEEYLATPIILTSEMIHDEGRTCTLKGDLSFVKWNNDDQKWEDVTPEEGDEYCLYYLLNDADYSYIKKNYYPRFDYSLQDGSVATASQCDFAEVADVKLNLNGSTITFSGTVPFENLQSMFRQKLIFKNSANETVTPSIKALTIDTEKGSLVSYYNPTCEVGGSPEKYSTFSIDIDDPVISDGSIFLSLSFYYPDEDSKDDKLILTATDTEGNVYVGSKDVPMGGFQNGKYYYGNCELVWDHQSIKPTVTRSDGGDPDELEPFGDCFDIYDAPSDEFNITISGSSSGYYFYLNAYPATVTLTGDGTAVYSGNAPFVYDDDGDVTIVLGSDYSIICPDYSGAIWAEWGELKLKTTGSSQTLTVTVNSETYKGLYGDKNYDSGGDVSQLAADGFTVTCSDMTNNHDGTYTWVYTVTPNV